MIQEIMLDHVRVILTCILFMCFVISFIFITLIYILCELKEQNRWLKESEEIDNIGKQ